MRIGQILNEKSLARGDFKRPERVQALLNKINNGEEFDLVGYTGTVKIAKDPELISQLQDGIVAVTALPLENGGSIALSKLEKTAEFGGQSARPVAGQEQQPKEDNTIANRGEISEGILGAAMTAKFAARDQNGIGTVTQADVESVLNSLADSGQDEYTAMIRGKDGQFVDSLIFVLRLKSAPYADLMNPAKRKLLSSEFASAIKYVNSKAATRYAAYFYQNDKQDMVKVISDGVSDETGRKTDVYVTAESPIGSPAKGLKSLDISLKAGAVKQFGQVGGNSFESLQKLFSAFKIDVSPAEAEYNRLAATDVMLGVKSVYEYAAKWMQTNLRSNKREASTLKNFVDGIDYYATLNQPNVRIVHFDKGDFEVLDFKKLYKVADAYDFDAKVVMAGKAGNLPQIQIYDVNSGERFLTLRTKLEKKNMYVRNYVEKEELLSKITRTEY